MSCKKCGGLRAILVDEATGWVDCPACDGIPDGEPLSWSERNMSLVVFVILALTAVLVFVSLFLV
jgi:hypothetical protein